MSSKFVFIFYMRSGRGEPQPWQAALREDDLWDVHGGDRQTGRS